MGRGLGLGLGLVLVIAALARRKPGPNPAPPNPAPPNPAPPNPAPPNPAPPVPAPPVPADLPPDADPALWVQLASEPGLKIRIPSRAWTTAAARAVLRQGAAAALALGGQLVIADAGPAAGPGNEYKPHKSHRWGRDFDVAYTADGVYPTAGAVPVDPRVPAILESMAPWIEVVGTTAPRNLAFAGRPYKVTGNWPGHVGHLHLRLRKDLTTEP